MPNSKIEQFKKNFKQKIEGPERIIITSHISPDDDSIASILSTYYYLKNILKITKTVEMINSGNKAERWQYFKNFEKIKFIEDITSDLKKDDLLIMLDTKDYDRITNHPEKIKELGMETICIDHHKSPPRNKHTLYLSHPTVKFTSNAELIYEVLLKEHLKDLENSILETVLLGILGDTGNFRFIKGAQDLSALETAKEIIKKGNINVDDFQSNYQKISKESLKVLQIYLNNLRTKEIKGYPSFAYSYAAKKDLEQFSKQAVSEGGAIFKGYVKNLRDLTWGFYIRYDFETKAIKASFRADPKSVNVREIAEDLGGGGHDGASGANLSMSRNVQTVKKGLETVFNYLKSN